MKSFSHSHNIKCCFHSKKLTSSSVFMFSLKISTNYSYMNIHLLLEMQNEDIKFSYETFNKIEFILKTKNKYLSTRYDMFLL